MKLSRCTPSRRRPGCPRFWILLATPSLFGVGSCQTETGLVPMRDGVRLPTDVHEASRGSGPSVLVRTPYGRSGPSSSADSFTEQGYHFYSQDIRGTGEAEGEFEFFRADGAGGLQDGYDTLEWIAQQDTSDGNVCIFGGTALGITAVLAAGSGHPALRCVYAWSGAGDLYADVAYPSGVLRTEVVQGLLKGMNREDVVALVESHPTRDEFWQEASLREHIADIQAPMYLMTGWFDAFSQASLDLYSQVSMSSIVSERSIPHRLVVGPWSSTSPGPLVGELSFPPGSEVPGGEEMRWFDRWLKHIQNGIDEEAPVRYYRMGDVDASSPYWNVWIDTDRWPVPSEQQPWYLHPGGGLSPALPPPDSEPQRFSFDPTDPVPTACGANLYLMSGPCDQRGVESRSDVLVFTSEVLEAPLAITGRLRADLWVESSAPDTDFTVKLTDVYPDGRSMLVADGIARARYRNGTEAEALMVPGERYELAVDLWSTSLVFNAGHRLRVAISSSNMPRFEPNSNTGAPLDTLAAASWEIAEQRVHLSAEHPSAVVLPIVPLELEGR